MYILAEKIAAKVHKRRNSYLHVFDVARELFVSRIVNEY